MGQFLVTSVIAAMHKAPLGGVYCYDDLCYIIV